MAVAKIDSWLQAFHSAIQPASSLHPPAHNGNLLMTRWGRARSLAVLSISYALLLICWTALYTLGLEVYSDYFPSLLILGGSTIPFVYGLSRSENYLLGSTIFGLLHLITFVYIVRDASCGCGLENDLSLPSAWINIQLAFCILDAGVIIGHFIFPRHVSMGFVGLSLAVGVLCSIFFFRPTFSMVASSVFTLCILSVFSFLFSSLLHDREVEAKTEKASSDQRDWLYRNLLHHMPVAVFELDKEGLVCCVNKEACHALKKPIPLPTPRPNTKSPSVSLSSSGTSLPLSRRRIKPGQEETGGRGTIPAPPTLTCIPEDLEEPLVKSRSVGINREGDFYDTSSEEEGGNENGGGGKSRSRSNSWSSSPSRPSLLAILGGPQGKSSDNIVLGFLGKPPSGYDSEGSDGGSGASTPTSLPSPSLPRGSGEQENVKKEENEASDKKDEPTEKEKEKEEDKVDEPFSFFSLVSVEDMEKVKNALRNCIEEGVPLEDVYFTSSEEYGRRLYACSFVPVRHVSSRDDTTGIYSGLKRLDGRKLFKRNRATILGDAQKWRERNEKKVVDSKGEGEVSERRRLFEIADREVAEGEAGDKKANATRMKRKRPLKRNVNAKKVCSGGAFDANNVICYAVDVTDALRKIEFKKAKLQAEKETHTKGRFLANVSHELRTPLHGIIGMMDQLMDTKLDKEQTRYAKIMTSSAESLLQLVNDLLDLSKLEAGKLPLETVNFDPAVVIQKVINMIMVDIERKKLTLGVFIHDRIPSLVRGDPTRLQQILLNLLSNSVKFTPKGGTIILKCSIRAGHILYFDVTDTGIGIRESAIPHLFSSFQQAEASTTRKFGGTGLGLAICKQICNQMGGSIGVESTYGKGSHFWFTVVLEAVFPKEVEPGFDFENADVSVRSNNPLIRDLLKNYVTMWQGVFLNDDVGVDVGGVGVVRTKKAEPTETKTEAAPTQHNINSVEGKGGAGKEGIDKEGGSVNSNLGEGGKEGNNGNGKKSTDEGRKCDAGVGGSSLLDATQTVSTKRAPAKKSSLKWEIWVDMSPLEQQLVANLISKMNQNRLALEEANKKEKGKEKEEKEKESETQKDKEKESEGSTNNNTNRLREDPSQVVKVDIKSPIHRNQLLDTLHEALRRREEALGRYTRLSAATAVPPSSTNPAEGKPHPPSNQPAPVGAGMGTVPFIPTPLWKMKQSVNNNHNVNDLLSASTGDFKSILSEDVKISVLLVEDNKINQTIAKKMLSRGGEGWTCEVDMAENGAEAVKLYMKKKYDVVFMDLAMPVMDGYAATRLIRGYEERMGGKDRVVVIAVTASAMEDDRNQCLAAGMDDVLTKPFRAEALSSCIRKWIQQPNQAQLK